MPHGALDDAVTANLVFLYRKSVWGGENLPFSISNSLELSEQVPCSLPFQALRSQECCRGCMLGVLWQHGNHHNLCEMHAVFAAPVRLDRHNVFTDLAKPWDSYFMQGLLNCRKKIKCHSGKFLHTSLGLPCMVVPGPLKVQHWTVEYVRVFHISPGDSTTGAAWAASGKPSDGWATSEQA